MERVKLRCREACLGEITLRDLGGRTEVRASMEDPGDGLYRAALRGERGELMLGVLAPEGGMLTLRRMVYTRDVAALGRLVEGEARQSFPFRPAGWRETRCPAQLFRSSFFQTRLRSAGRAWWTPSRRRNRCCREAPARTEGPAGPAGEGRACGFLSPIFRPGGPQFLDKARFFC